MGPLKQRCVRGWGRSVFSNKCHSARCPGLCAGRLWRGRDKEADPAVNVTASELREEKILCQIAYCLRLLNLL